MLRHAFLDGAGRLRGGWWIAIFFAVLIGLLLPLLLLARAHGGTVPLHEHGAVVLAASLICLGLRRAPVAELLFRGFLFQRLLDGLGPWPAQGIIGGLFLLTHSDALRAQGLLGLLAGTNIFLASLLFGVAYLRTRSLAMPLGLHVAANAVQGPVLGFGVSGSQGASLLTPELGRAPAWLDGGTFGLEASLPGLLSLVALLAVLWRWRLSAP